MKKRALLLTATVLSAAAAVAYQYSPTYGRTTEPMARTQKLAARRAPRLLMCDLGAMTPAQRLRHDNIGKQLRLATKQVKELPNGYAFRYAPDPVLFMAAAEFITMESRCCSFYHFSLEKEPGEGPIWLRVTGPREAKSFIKPVLAPERS